MQRRRGIVVVRVYGLPLRCTNSGLWDSSSWPDDALPFEKEYDEESIMHYVFSSTWFVDNRSRGGRHELSQKEKEFAAKLYPRTPG